MSLTQMLKLAPIKAMFKEAFPVAKPRLEGDLLAPPISGRASHIGTAFDYLLRFHLERTFAPSVTTKWIAEHAITALDRGAIEYDKGWLADAKSKLRAAQTAHHNYLDTGKVGDDLIRSAFDLVQLDVFYRTGRTYDFVTAENADVDDLRNLLTVAVRCFPKPSQTCYLNPNFGEASSLVSGADADLIIDGVLIDIKTTKTLSFKQDMYNQLIGYYLLSRLGRINDKENVDLSSAGIYFARYGLLHTVSTVGLKKTAEEGFLDLFEKAAKSLFVAERTASL